MTEESKNTGIIPTVEIQASGNDQRCNNTHICCSTLGNQRTRPKERALEGDSLLGMSISMLACP